jgi:hypothetical protein
MRCVVVVVESGEAVLAAMYNAVVGVMLARGIALRVMPLAFGRGENTTVMDSATR